MNIDNFDIKGITHFGTFSYGENKDKTCATVTRMIEINDIGKIKLSSEHDKMAWISEDEIDDYEFVWTTAKKIIRDSFKFREKNEK